MSSGRPWYREPESFIALAALVVSISAVAVGIYEATLQRAHDRAEVWPHVEVGTFTTSTDATLYIENTGVGPAVISSIVFSLDGKPRTSWDDLLPAWLGKGAPAHFSHSTVGVRRTLAHVASPTRRRQSIVEHSRSVSDANRDVELLAPHV